MSNAVRIIFSGEILPGHSPETVREQIGSLLKLRPGQVEHVFSGKKVVLKRGLPESEAPRYIERLTRAGIQVHIEAENPPTPARAAASPMPPIPVSPTPQASPVESAPPTAPLIEEMDCPSCGARQPKRTLCRECGTDMPRFIEAQRVIKAEASAPPRQAPRATPAHQALPFLSADAPMFGLSLAGRAGRLRYLTAHFFLFAILFLLMRLVMAGLQSGHLSPGLLFGFLGSMVVLYWHLRIVCLRLHDLGYTGWLALILCLPVVGFLVWTALFLLPGAKENNDWGNPPATPRLRVTVFALLAVCVSAYSLAHVVQHRAKHMDETESTAAVSYSSAENRVVMYSLTTCGYCVAKHRELKEASIPFTEYFIDTDLARRDELIEKIRRANLPVRPYGTPILEVNGTLLPDNPSLQEIRELLIPQPQG